VDGPPAASTPGPDGAVHPGGRPGHLSRLSVGAGVVGLLAGLLFAANASVFAGTETRQPQDLQGLARAEAERLESLEKENADLRADIAPFLRDGAETPSDGAAPDSEADLSALALEAVRGPGVEVQLWDAPQSAGQEGFAPDDLVVHQQDLQAVVNALWAGGAEALQIMDQRVISTSAVRCVGATLILQGRLYSPPYRVTAIGDPQRLSEALDTSPGVQLYLYYADTYGLDYGTEELDDVRLPGYDGSLDLLHAGPA